MSVVWLEFAKQGQASQPAITWVIRMVNAVRHHMRLRRSVVRAEQRGSCICHVGAEFAGLCDIHPAVRGCSSAGEHCGLVEPQGYPAALPCHVDGGGQRGNLSDVSLHCPASFFQNVAM